MRTFFVIFCILMTCVSGNAATLESLQDISAPPEPEESKQIPIIRQNALRDTALALGTQAGLNERAKEYQTLIEGFGDKLDKLYRFAPLFLKQGILPPVIDEAKNAVVLESDDVIRFADRIYKIEKPERFVTLVPTWREYLYTGLNVTPPHKEVHPLLKPATDSEKALWKEYIEIGWLAGREQADDIFNENIARLEREYTGMIRYKILYAKSMITSPVVNSLYRTTAGTTNEMSVNDRVYRITGKSELNLDSDKWKSQAVAK